MIWRRRHVSSKIYNTNYTLYAYSENTRAESRTIGLLYLFFSCFCYFYMYSYYFCFLVFFTTRLCTWLHWLMRPKWHVPGVVNYSSNANCVFDNHAGRAVMPSGRIIRNAGARPRRRRSTASHGHGVLVHNTPAVGHARVFVATEMAAWTGIGGGPT